MKIEIEAFRSCEESLAEMVHTRDGSRAVREFVARGSAKVSHCMLALVKTFY